MNEKCDIEELDVDLKTYDIDQKYKEFEEAKFTGSFLLTFNGSDTNNITAWFKNGKLHKEDGPAMITEIKMMSYEDFYLNGIKYGSIDSIYDTSENGKIFIPDEFLLQSYETNGITFYEFLREDKILIIPHIKGLVSNLTKKQHKVMDYAFMSVGYRFIDDFHKFENEFWPLFLSGKPSPEYQELTQAINDYLKPSLAY